MINSFSSVTHHNSWKLRYQSLEIYISYNKKNVQKGTEPKWPLAENKALKPHLALPKCVRWLITLVEFSRFSSLVRKLFCRQNLSK